MGSVFEHEIVKAVHRPIMEIRIQTLELELAAERRELADTRRQLAITRQMLEDFTKLSSTRIVQLESDNKLLIECRTPNECSHRAVKSDRFGSTCSSCGKQLEGCGYGGWFGTLGCVHRFMPVAGENYQVCQFCEESEILN